MPRSFWHTTTLVKTRAAGQKAPYLQETDLRWFHHAGANAPDLAQRPRFDVGASQVQRSPIW